MKTKIYTAITIALCIVAQHAKAQNTFPSSGKVGIGTRSPDASSLLELKSTTKGILIPRMTQAQRNGISSPAIGLMVYVTDINAGFYYYSDSSWTELLPSYKSWLTTGDSSLDTASNFIGTIDKSPFIIRTDNIERIYVSANGNVGIGTSSPSAILNVMGTGYLSLKDNAYIMLGKTNAYNLAMDNSQIQARFNKSYSALTLNQYGGTVYTGNGSSSDYGLSSNGSYCGVYGYGSESGSVGVYGEGYTYGVYGISGGMTAIYGGTLDSNTYAGYFSGNVYTTGTYTSSDATLKQNIKDMSNAMNILNQLKPKYYNFRQDGIYTKMNLPRGKHYGLIAQEVEKILPGLVRETKFDTDMATPLARQTPPDFKNPATSVIKPAVAKTGEIIDFKALNYTELIPIIIKGMQEMNKTNDSLKAENNALNQRLTKIEAMLNINTSSSGTVSSSVPSASLQQNIPNPFSSATTIGYNLPSNYSSASIIVTDAKGVVLKQISLNSKGKGNVQLDASTLASGAYRYSLYIDGRMVNSKQMISSK